MLSVSGLSVSYGGIRAVRSVSLRVEAGEAVAILGPNGAGKTTLLNTLAGLRRPTEGTVLLDGREVTGRRAERLVNDGIALVPEGRGVFGGLSVADNLMLGAYRRRREDGLPEDLDEVLELFPVLRERARQRASTLSGGEQQMLAIGRALMAKPRLLLLDEPSLGLAPLAVRQVVARLVELRDRGRTILLVEQNTRAALRVATRGYLLQRGEVALEGTREQLLETPSVKAAYLGRGATEPGVERR
ncbi:MAG: ABC transporter ATP-binding protein [Thermoleophilaceae bacterium]